jgi:rhombotail lipoprotein
MNRWHLVALLVSALTLSGCVAMTCWSTCAAHSHNSSSLVDFLFPDGKVPIATEQPQLSIPLRVGLGFLPSVNTSGAGLDEAHQQELLERIRQRFMSRRFVSDIVLVPDYYLATHRGFAGLEGVQRLYDLDVIALVSFDQETILDQNDWSLAYLTIVGAYVVKGNRHDVSTLVDLAVVDPRTRKLIIRAGGADLRHGNTTLVEANRETHAANITGFSAATNLMIDHFDHELSRFEADVKSGTAPVRVLSKNTGDNVRGGGGALGGSCIGLLLLAVVRRAASQQVEE